MHLVLRVLRALSLVLVVAVVSALVAACGEDEGVGGDATEVTIGLSFVPNIQFAPFYAAIEQGYYADEGLEVTLNHHAAGADLFGALVAGQEDLVMAGGDEAIQARAKGADLVYVAEVFRDYPVSLIVPADSDIQTVADVAGRKVGLPGAYGANYLGLLALLDSAGLTEEDIDMQSVGFTQVTALLDKQVDAVMGYSNNEPIQLEKAGMPVRTFPVADVMPLVSNGLVTTGKMLTDDPETVRKVVAATLKGLQYAIDNPQETVELSKQHVPTLSDEQQATDALAVLQASIPLWQSDRAPGASDPAAWQAMADFLRAHNQLDADVPIAEVYTDEFLPQ
jgi:NitT/TauT family transport system substrate-binding protein